jgi:hypothetical protein
VPPHTHFRELQRTGTLFTCEAKLLEFFVETHGCLNGVGSMTVSAGNVTPSSTFVLVDHTHIDVTFISVGSKISAGFCTCGKMNRTDAHLPGKHITRY